MEDMVQGFGTVEMDSDPPFCLGTIDCSHHIGELSAMVEIMPWALERVEVEQGEGALEQGLEQGARSQKPLISKSVGVKPEPCAVLVERDVCARRACCSLKRTSSASTFNKRA